ncbi:MAG: hypothetical protein M1834_008929 [Cirrosporium novae-zelandiae]|nr:MAG: hypothetical protein M1834_008929 [Cirrosporium novae-zelandiae]
MTTEVEAKMEAQFECPIFQEADLLPWHLHLTVTVSPFSFPHSGFIFQFYLSTQYPEGKIGYLKILPECTCFQDCGPTRFWPPPWAEPNWICMYEISGFVNAKQWEKMTLAMHNSAVPLKRMKKVGMSSIVWAADALKKFAALGCVDLRGVEPEEYIMELKGFTEKEILAPLRLGQKPARVIRYDLTTWLMECKKSRAARNVPLNY